MELRELRYFLTVAREGSIRRASQRLNISQPGLSKAIMNLESQLGVQLFERHTRRLIITPRGQYLRSRAREIIDLADKTQMEFDEFDRENISGEIFIGGGETEGMRLIAKSLYALKEKHPHITYHLYSGNGDDVKERLDKGLLDFGLLIEPADVSRYDYIRLPIYDSWGLLVKKEHPLAQREFITPEDLKDIPLICSRQSLVEKEFSSWLGFDIKNLNVTATYNLIFNASLLVDEGVGCALTLNRLVNTAPHSSFTFIPLKPALRANLIMVWKKYQVFSKAAEKFLQVIRREIEKEKNSLPKPENI